MTTLSSLHECEPDTFQVLHVDDDPQFAELTATMLERADDRLTVETAKRVAAGLEILEESTVDCIVSDYNMPDQNGIDFLETVRRDRPTLPFMLFTGKGSEEVASEAITAGVTDYLQKEAGTEQYTVLANRIVNAITQYRSQQIVENNERQLRAIIDALPHLLFLVDEDGRYVLANETLASFHGTSVDAIETKHVRDVLTDSEATQFLEDMQAVIESGTKKRIPPLEIEAPTGETHLFEPRLLPYEPVTGDKDTVLGISVDVTDRVTRQRELERNRDRMQLALEHTDSIIFEIDIDSGSVVRDGSFEQFFDFPPSSVPTWEDHVERAIHPDDRDSVRLFFTEITDGDRTGGEIEYRTSPDVGEVRWIRDTVSVETDEQDQPSRAIGLARDVTEQKERQHELERTNELLSTLFETLPMAVLAEDHSRNVIALNGKLFELFDFPGTPSEVIGADCAALAHDVSDTFVDPAGFVDRIEELIEQGTPVDDEELTLGDGRTFARSHRLIDLPDGTGHLWTYRDITERVEHERERREMTSQLQAAIEAGAVGTWEWDIQTDDIVTNAKFARTFGVDPAAAETGVSIDRFVSSIHEADRERVERSIDTAVTECGEYAEEYRVRGDEDVIRWVSARGHVACDDYGTPMQFRGALTDITDRKSREQQLKALNETMRELMTAETHDHVANIGVRAGREILGLEANSLYRHDEERPALVPIATTEACRERIGTPPTITGEDSVVWRAFTDGEPVAVDADDDGDPNQYTPETAVQSELLVPIDDYGMLIAGSPTPEAFDEHDLVLADILAGNLATAFDQVAQTERLRAREREQERQNEQLEEFTSVVSHDLRNPLNVAQARLDQVRTECDSEYIDEIAWAHDRMNTLITDLLALARDGNHISELERVDLNLLADRCWQNVVTADAVLEIDTDRTIQADPNRLQQILENLLRNAVEHGGSDVTIQIGDLDNGFFVEDDGRGIPDHTRDSVFTAGVSTTENGTGFGLAIVKQVADAHDWKITLTESESGGARFEFTGISDG